LYTASNTFASLAFAHQKETKMKRKDDTFRRQFDEGQVTYRAAQAFAHCITAATAHLLH